MLTPVALLLITIGFTLTGCRSRGPGSKASTSEHSAQPLVQVYRYETSAYRPANRESYAIVKAFMATFEHRVRKAEQK